MCFGTFKMLERNLKENGTKNNNKKKQDKVRHFTKVAEKRI